MAGVTAQGATFTFQGAVATVVSVLVETPSAEIVDMTGVGDSPNTLVLVPTTAYAAGGSIAVDYMASSVPQAELGTVGMLQFRSPAFSVQRRAILESATVEAKVGDLVRGTMRFRLTDYLG